MTDMSTLHCPYVDGGPPLRVWPGVLPFGSGGRCCAGTPRVSSVDSDGGYGPLAYSGWPRRPRAGYYTPGRGLPGLSHVSSAAVWLVVRAGLTGLPPCTSLCWILVLKEL